VLVCYLDDSGKDPQCSITTLAGYIARDTAWEAFETDVDRWFAEYDINVLHARDLHASDGEFSDKEKWTVLRKQAFVSRICQARTPHLMMGLTMSVLKGQYKDRAKERGRRRTVTPYSFCFNVLNDWIFRDIQIANVAHTEGVAYIIEAGHENNAEVEGEFFAIKEQHPDIAPLMRSISFVSKDDCRAIQLADLLAFYSRRNGEAQLKARKAGLEGHVADTMDRIIIENLPHRAFVATDFGPEASGSYFLAGDP